MSSQPNPPNGSSNRLAKESSPYLRQHADNPVDWFPWGDEALEKAKQENKPILLSIGYSACHWCHVMAHESFANPDIARLMNEYFINVKVDREERPDLDQLYQGVVLLMGKGGGWPLTVFLTPDLRPFFGGTYFPPQDKFGMPGFPKLLEALHGAWLAKQDDVQDQAKQFETGLQQLAAYGLDTVAEEINLRDLIAAGQKLDREIDRENGGFGSAPKFPNPMNVGMLLRTYRRTGTAAMINAVKLTLDKMALGGIYDQLGGGFHRYSVDEHWRVPHFEKMLYDNAQLLHLYAEAYQLEPKPLYKKVVEETVAYVQREMTSPAGGFYATQDADTEGEEGRFFVWKPAEVRALLSPEQASLLELHFDITEAGNFEHGATVLEARRSVEDLAREFQKPPEEIQKTLDEARRILFEAREKRVKPGRDEKILAGWNGLMIRGLALAARAFARPDWAALAKGAADFVLREQWKDGRLLRSYQDGTARIDGFIEDYGNLASGLTGLYQATFEPKYLEAAEALVQRAVELFWDEGKQAYFSAPKGQKDLLCATYALQDNAFPSGASSLAEAQVMLGMLTGKPAHLEQAGRYIQRMRDELVRNPFAHGHLLLAADSFLDAAEVSIVGNAKDVGEFVAVVNAAYAPTVAVIAHDVAQPVPAVLEAVLKDRPAVDGKTAAYLCRHFTCELPVTDPAELKSRLFRMAAAHITSF